MLLAVVFLLLISSLNSLPVGVSDKFNPQAAVDRFRQAKDAADTHDITDADWEAETREIQPRTDFHMDFTQMNESDIVVDRSSILEVIPLDYICDFCRAVIAKLKERQSKEPNFQQKLHDDCLSYNDTERDDETICELVNKVNLARLHDESPNQICSEEKFCRDKETEQDIQNADDDKKKDNLETNSQPEFASAQNEEMTKDLTPSIFSEPNDTLPEARRKLNRTTMTPSSEKSAKINSNHNKVSGDATIRLIMPRVVVDRTVKLELVVDDIA